MILKRSILALIIVLQTCFAFGQDFEISEDYHLTELSYEEIQALFLQKGFDGFASIYIVDDHGKKLQEIKVYAEHYIGGALKVEELMETNLSRVNRIIKVAVPDCYCYCPSSTYYWIITNDHKWIPLPTIINEDYELSLTFNDYVFLNEKPDLIFLYEYQDEVSEITEVSGSSIQRKSEKVLAEFIWDGENILLE